MKYKDSDIAYLRQELGIIFPGAMRIATDGMLKGERGDLLAMDALRKSGVRLVPWGGAMDADLQPSLVTVASSGIPFFLSTFIDPEIYEILIAPMNATKIYGEQRKGDWTSTSAYFPVNEYTGTVSAYDDFSEQGRSNLNMNFPAREPFLYQTIMQYGDRESDMAGLAKVAWASELKKSAIRNLTNFQNLTYFYGVSGLANYGILNDPALQPPISPSPKQNDGIQWWNGNIPNAQATEVYADILSLYTLLVQQTGGLVDQQTNMKLVLSPKSQTALSFTNSFNVNVMTLLKGNFPNLEIVAAVQFGVQSQQNTQGNLVGEYVQLIVESVEGQKTGLTAFNEKLRGGPVIRGISSFKQKMIQGTFGAIIKMPVGVAQMVGV